MLPRERIHIIREIVSKEKKVFTRKLSEQFNVTQKTVRQDLRELESQGIITIIYGGAVLNSEKITEEMHYYKRSKTNIESEKYIASKAVELIKYDSTIVADCSSTVIETLKLISDRKDVKVISNSIQILQELNKFEFNFISTGGGVKPRYLALEGPITHSTIRKYNFDIAIVGCNGLDMEKGILDSNEAEVEIKRSMINQANKVILLVDHSKFDRISLVKVFEYENIAYLITDSKPKEEWINFLSAHNIKIIY